jgi:cyclopropane-fatty-acyl-phospholipid synthase
VSEARLPRRFRRRGRDHEAISQHYEVSNEFYRLMLGPTMIYTCAYFDGADESLERAQQRKLDLVCRELDLQPGERLVDIGCGWGALAIHAARNYGARVVGVTVSEAQARFARDAVAAEGLSGSMRDSLRRITARWRTGHTTRSPQSG